MIFVFLRNDRVLMCICIVYLRYQLRNRPVHEAGTARVRVCACRCRRQCGCGLCRLRILQAGVERRSYLGTGCHAHAVQAPRLVCDCDSPHEPALLLAKIDRHQILDDRAARLFLVEFRLLFGNFGHRMHRDCLCLELVTSIGIPKSCNIYTTY